MSRGSLQKVEGKVRPPRVHIQYDVETNGAIEKRDLPFVVGILADLSGDRLEPLDRLEKRGFATIDRDNFNQVLAEAAPRLVLKPKNTLTGEGSLGIELNFRNLDDFTPGKVAEQVPVLKEMLDIRRRLKELESKTEGKAKAQDLLNQILADMKTAEGLARERGLVTESAKAAQPEGQS